MPSKISWFNKELILQIIRNSGWISLVYFLGLSLALPLRILMLYTDETFMKNNPLPVKTLYEYDFPIQLGLILVIPILMSVFLFRFLQVKQSADLMHSLPMKRGKTFHHYAVSGMVGLILPVIIISFIVAAIHGVLDLNNFYQLKDVWYWGVSTIVLTLLLFMAGVFVAMMTGISAVQGVLTYIFLLFPAGITVLVFYNLRDLLFGFPGDYYLDRNLDKMSPLTYANIMDGQPLQTRELILYAVFTFILYGLSVYFYKIRRIESATEAIAFPKLRVFFKYGVTFCMMLVGGMYFGEVRSNSFGWIVFGFVLGAIIGYYVAEMLLQKTWRVFGRIKGLVIYGIILFVLVSSIKLFGFYEDHVPDEDTIKNVLFAETAYVRQNLDEMEYYMDVPEPIKGKENIEAIRQLHQEIVSNKGMELELGENDYPDTAFFLYELNNGEKVIRQYEVNKKMYEKLYSTIYESEEYKLASNEIFKLPVDQITHLTISANRRTYNEYQTFTKQEEIQQIIEKIQSDVLEESYQDREYFMDTGYMIEIQFGKDKWFHMNYRPTFHGLTTYFSEKDLLDKVQVLPEDISYMQIVKTDSLRPELELDGNWNISYFNPDEVVRGMKNISNLLKVTDKEQIKEILASAAASTGRENEYPYVVSFHYADEVYPEVYYIDEAHTPDFINKYFQK